jgi:hypothetical protein
MQTPIIVALIAGGFAIIAPIVTFIVTRSYENRFLQPVSSNRVAALVGSWEGTTHQECGPGGKPDDAKVSFKLALAGKKLRGQGIFRTCVGAEEVVITFHLSGGFLHDRFLRFDYNPEASETVQFGSIIVELSNDAKKLTGRYMGYGAFTNALVYGTVCVTKMA